ncbi:MULTISPECIES: hypothetical protein [Bacteroides]
MPLCLLSGRRKRYG